MQFHVTSRSSTSRYAPWTVFKSQFCGFAAQKYSTKLQLKNCRLARRYIGQEIKCYSFGKIAKEKAQSYFLKGCSFWFYASAGFVFLPNERKNVFGFMLRLVQFSSRFEVWFFWHVAKLVWFSNVL